MDEVKVERIIEGRINRFLVEDAREHRVFLETMFKRVLGGVAALAAIFGTTLYFVWGNSVDEAAVTAVRLYVLEDAVADALQEEISTALDEATPVLLDKARSVATSMIENGLEEEMNEIAAPIPR